MTNPQLEIRIWKDSSIIGKTVEEISNEFNVEMIKVARGAIATEPPGKKLRILEADYITFQGKNTECVKLLRASG